MEDFEKQKKFGKFRYHLFWFIGILLSGGIMIPFCAQFLLPVINTNAVVVGAEVWNVYVGIILGIVATIVSIVSLILGFKASDDTLRSQMEISQMISELTVQIEVMKEIQRNMSESQRELEKGQNDLKGMFSESNKTSFDEANKDKNSYDRIRKILNDSRIEDINK